jgi:hypothetical protein
MLVSLEVVRCAIVVACMAYRRLVPSRSGDISRLEWCCGCVTDARRMRGTVVWTNETSCPQHRNAPLRSVYPPLGGSDGFPV